MKPYDYLIVGCGLFGATFARLATDCGKKCLILDKRSHIGGNCYTTNIEGINVHRYGAHIFHTSNKVVWNFVNRFAEFNNFINSPKALSGEKLYSLPFNMNTFYELWGVVFPKDAKMIIENQKFKETPTNLEEQALSLVGRDVYNTLIKDYTQKQWGKDPKELPPFIIKRLPTRYTYDNNYFNDIYQGIPIGGYTQMFKNMIDGIEVQLETDYLKKRNYFDSFADHIVYTGCIDEFFSYCFGKLEYRSLYFVDKILNTDNHQGVAVINHCDKNYLSTRSIEHKHFENIDSKKTVVTYEYSVEHTSDNEPYYPVNTDTNQNVYKKYKDLTKSLTNFTFGGRLSEYKYMDMHVVIESAMNKFKSISK